MLFARAVSRLCRRLFQDVLLGCAYVPEELGAQTNAEGDVIAVTPVQELNAKIEQTATIQDVLEPTDEIIERVETATKTSLLTAHEEITPSQIKQIHALKTELSLTDVSYRAGLQKIAGVSSSKDLTASQAAEVIKALTKKAQSPTYWENQVEAEVLS